jgi:hypothetical protein
VKNEPHELDILIDESAAFEFNEKPLNLIINTTKRRPLFDFFWKVTRVEFEQKREKKFDGNSEEKSSVKCLQLKKV